MASFNETIITKKGQELLMETIGLGSSFEFTRICTSEDKIIYDKSIEEIENFTIENQVLEIKNIEIIDQNTLKITTALENTNLQKGYFMRNIGLFAKKANEEEILYSITTTQQADYIPAYSNKRVSSVILDILTVVSDTSNISINIDPSHSITIKDFNEKIEEIKKQIDSKSPSDHKHKFSEIQEVPEASTNKKGIVQLSSDLENDSETLGATAKVIKILNEKIKEVLQSGVDVKEKVMSAINSKLTVPDLPSNATWNDIINAIKVIKEGRGNAQPSHVLEPYTFTNDEGRELTGSIPNRGNGRTITPTTTDINLDYGYYATKNIIKGDTNLKPENIKKGVRIFGVVGSMVDTSLIINKHFPSSGGRTVRTSLYFNPMPINAYDYEVTITLMGETFVRTGNNISVETSNGKYTASVYFTYVTAESNWDSEGTKVDISASCTDVYDVSLGGVGIKIRKIR